MRSFTQVRIGGSGEAVPDGIGVGSGYMRGDYDQTEIAFDLPCTRVLELAAREFDVVGMSIRLTPEGEVDWTSVRPEATAQKIHGAGDGQ